MQPLTGGLSSMHQAPLNNVLSGQRKVSSSITTLGLRCCEIPTDSRAISVAELQSFLPFGRRIDNAVESFSFSTVMEKFWHEKSIVFRSGVTLNKSCL